MMSKELFFVLFKLEDKKYEMEVTPANDYEEALRLGTSDLHKRLPDLLMSDLEVATVISVDLKDIKEWEEAMRQ